MYRSGLILAGLVGGLLLSGGSALAATTQVQMPMNEEDGDNNSRVFFFCGDDNTIARESSANQTGLLVLNTGDILSGILGRGSGDDIACSATTS
ncbi:hypothetical protein E1267_19380 [Nonomuraea longispora]|uniref:Uncharacterized protein n=1 Tax=Nonomuraea longispora TaxID=1848320 RepID=A0A4R4N9F3_9ACTN|nr:hypothetical protein [Nonomuraea longispora]TDC05469.1 hypothetical protein E1267_19380 [Nonomuraea longispora]